MTTQLISESKCVFLNPGRYDPFPEIVFKAVPSCKHVLLVRNRNDVLMLSFCNDVFGNDKFTFHSIVHDDPKRYEKIIEFVKTYRRVPIITTPKGCDYKLLFDGAAFCFQCSTPRTGCAYNWKQTVSK